MSCPDHFHTLGLTSGATSEQVKQAYRTLLLQHHPDKQPRRKEDSRTPTPTPSWTKSEETQEDRVIALTEAYRVLSDPVLRAEYERDGGRHNADQTDGTTRDRQRNPTCVISLEEWTYHPATSNGEEQAEQGNDPDASAYYTHPCRCSGTFIITESQLEDGVDIVGCEGCGEWVGVGYEVLEEGDDEGDEKREGGEWRKLG